MKGASLHVQFYKLRAKWFLSVEEMSEFEQACRNNQMGPGAARRQLANHLPGTCPRCGTEGYFGWGLFGRFSHPECGAKWVVNPFRFVLKQFGVGVALGTNVFTDPANFTGTDVGTNVISGCLVALVRVPIGLMFLPLQALIWIFGQKRASALTMGGDSKGP